MKEKFQKHADKLRFGIVGAFNTGLDFGLLFLLVFLGVGKIPANYISTTIAFLVSFTLNRNFTFRSKGDMKKQFLPFVTVTLFGLWVLQPIVIWLGVPVFENVVNASLALLASKILATGVTMVWNYLLYKRVVFKN